MLEDGSRLASSDTMTEGNEMELELSELEESSPEEEASLEEDSGVEERGLLEEGLGLEEAGVLELAGACEGGACVAGGVEVAGGSGSGAGVGVVSAGGVVSGEGSTTGVVGSGAGSTGAVDSGVRPITCCVPEGSSVAWETVPKAQTVQKSIVKMSSNAPLCFLNLKPPELSRRIAWRGIGCATPSNEGVSCQSSALSTNNNIKHYNIFRRESNRTEQAGPGVAVNFL